MKVISLILVLILFGCSSIGIRSTDVRKDIANNQIKDFQHYLNHGYEIYNYNGRILLIKRTDNDFDIKDIFGLLQP